MRKWGAYIMALLYVVAGVAHFLNPDFYSDIMPGWLPAHTELIFLSGIVEVLLGLGILLPRTRRPAAMLIILMLLVFLFIIHVPMVISWAQQGHQLLWVAIVRIPIQFLLIWWAALYLKPIKG